ncbi:MAG: hypothetical protein IKH78_09980 [Ruminococcus sp.]|nr:hypothetical protein [Ruminococcus sp.]
MKKHLITLLSLLILTACAEAPEEVQRENSILDNAEIASRSDNTPADSLGGDSSETGTSGSENGLALCTLDEIRASLESDIKGNKTNVSAKTVRVPESSAMPVFKLQKSFDNFDKIDDIVRDYFGTELSAHRDRLSLLTRFHSVFELTEDLTLDLDGCKGSLSYTDPANPTNRISSSGCGYFTAANTGASLVEPYSGELIAAYDLRHGESFPIESYTMTDGRPLSVSDGVKQAEEYANKYISLLYTDKTTVKVYRVEVYKRELGGCGYAMLAEYRDSEGNLFLTNDRVVMDTDAFLNKNAPLIPTVNLMLCVNESGKPPMITANAVPAVGEVTESGDKLLSFGGAVNALSKRLAASSAYEFGCASLEYVITAPYSEKYIEYMTDENGDVSKQFFKELYTHIPETHYEARPYWVFRDFEKNPENLGESVWGGVYLVDALTGEIYVR